MRIKQACLLVTLSISVVWIFPSSSHAQKESSNWYFGNRAGVAFTQDTAIALSDSQINTQEGCASISDCDGNLLFYTDGITIWNREHEIMENGEGLLGHPSSAQSSIIIKQPGSDQRYYVFAVAHEAGANGLTYSIVDMSLDDELGAVTNQKNILLHTPVCEKIAGTFHANGEDIWVYAVDYPANNFHAYLLTAAGLNTTPVVSQVGPNSSTGLDAIGYLKVSPSGSKMASIQFGSNRINVFNINQSNGQLSEWISITPDAPSGPYGAEFSWNEELLYVSYIYTGVYQFDLTLPTQEQISDTRIQLIAKTDVGALQLAPDGKIYLAASARSLDVIENPDERGLGCSYQSNGFDLGLNARGILGLPTFFVSRQSRSTITSDGTCLGDTTWFSSSSRFIDSLLWDFGDPSSGVANYSKESAPYHVYSDTGTYVVHFITFNGCTSDTLSTEVYVAPNPTVEFISDTIISCDDELTLSPITQDQLAFRWNDGSTDSTLDVMSNGIYQVSVTNSYACSDADTVVVLFSSQSLDMGADINRCAEDTVQIAVPPGFNNIMWSNGQSAQAIQGLLTGIYYITAADTLGCPHVDSIEVTTVDAPSINLGNDTFYCSDESIVIGIPSSPNQRYEWSIGDTTSMIRVSTADSYTLTITNDAGCQSTDSIDVQASNKPVPHLGPDTIVCDEENYVLSTGIDADQHFWQGNIGEPSFTISRSGTYYVEVVNSCGSGFDTVSIDLITCDCGIYVPNAFSPNGDGINDLFNGYSDCALQSYSLQVFNRWGGLVFSSNRPETGWDGTADEKKCLTGVYAYILSYQFENTAPQTAIGSLTLLE